MICQRLGVALLTADRIIFRAKMAFNARKRFRYSEEIYDAIKGEQTPCLYNEAKLIIQEKSNKMQKE